MTIVTVGCFGFLVNCVMSGPAEDVANTIFEGETDVTAPDCPSPTAKGLATWCNSDL